MNDSAKKCPYRAEQIPLEAVRCGHCAPMLTASPGDVPASNRRWYAGDWEVSEQAERRAA